MIQTQLPRSFRSSTDSSSWVFLSWLKPLLSRRDLEEIAANDYGEEVAEHLAGIESLLSEDPVSGLLPWCPHELLELERWQEPDRHNNHPSSGPRGHLKRLLACTLLLISASSTKPTSERGEEEFFLDSSASTLIQLTRSAIGLGGEWPSRALNFLLWL